LLLDKSFDNHLLLDKGLLVPFQEQSHLQKCYFANVGSWI
jgi:hypothetical protein